MLCLCFHLSGHKLLIVIVDLMLNMYHFLNVKKPFFLISDMPMQLEIVPAHSIIEMWDRVSISNGKGLLLTLGFDEDEIHISQLSKVIEEELRGLEGEAQMTLFKALMALQSAEITSLRQTFRQLSEENKKLRADNKDANRRVAMLAQEIDDRHASLEETAKAQVKLMLVNCCKKR